MGRYLNPDNGKFRRAINSEIYVDKTGLIAETNKVIDTEQMYMCVSRPRRFGKSMALEMLASYYDCESVSKELFLPYDIAKDETFDTHLGKYEVILVNMQNLLSKSENVAAAIALLTEVVVTELKTKYNVPNGPLYSAIDDVMEYVSQEYDKSFVVLIDEWDGLFRTNQDSKTEQKAYLDFLRLWLKDRSYIALAYMTGILPIKKYGSHSALNMFIEFSMTNQRSLTPYTGFTEDEVTELCKQYDMDFAEIESWYNGYNLAYLDNEISIYNPWSVVDALKQRKCASYWTTTESYEALKIYIDMNYDGLKDAIIDLLAGDKVKIDPSSYNNDMVSFSSYEDILTLLVHLGYLGFNLNTQEVFIPNKEISEQFVTAMKGEYGEVIAAVKASEDLLKATWAMDADAVAVGIAKSHRAVPHLKYNSGESLSNAISLAYYTAIEYYTIIKELPTGDGYADIVYIPKPNHMEKPAMIVELKWNQSPLSGLKQIHEKKYKEALKGYKDNLLLVGISYNKETRLHEAVIEKG
jgi:hypothetical protein